MVHWLRKETHGLETVSSNPNTALYYDDSSSNPAEAYSLFL